MALYAVICFIWTALGFVNLTPLMLIEEENTFKEWMSQHSKNYELEEYYRRLQIFTENNRRISDHNAGNHSFRMGLNQFSDMTFEEFRKFFLLTKPQNCSVTKGSHLSSSGPYPDSVDWREKGNFVTPVKNQGLCGSCWAFSTTGCVESVTAISTRKLLLLSEQQLIDCAQDFNNYGCLGGLPSQAFEYIKYNHGVLTEDDYPYKGFQYTCHFKPELAAAFVKDVVNITSYDEKGMVDAVARLNPVSFGYQVTADFRHYKEGVYTREWDSILDSQELLGHSLGHEWANTSKLFFDVCSLRDCVWKDMSEAFKRYFLIERGKNMCGLAACSSYPLV